MTSVDVIQHFVSLHPVVTLENLDEQVDLALGGSAVRVEAQPRERGASISRPCESSAVSVNPDSTNTSSPLSDRCARRVSLTAVLSSPSPKRVSNPGAERVEILDERLLGCDRGGAEHGRLVQVQSSRLSTQRVVELLGRQSRPACAEVGQVGGAKVVVDRADRSKSVALAAVGDGALLFDGTGRVGAAEREQRRERDNTVVGHRPDAGASTVPARGGRAGRPSGTTRSSEGAIDAPKRGNDESMQSIGEEEQRSPGASGQARSLPPGWIAHYYRRPRERGFMDTGELRATFEERGIRKVKVGGFDIDGILRGKLISLDKFWSAAEHGFGFCDVIFGWDLNDQLYDNAKVTGWHTGYPDALAKIDLDTFRVLRSEPDTACFIADFSNEDGSPHPACPRNLLRTIVARANARGFTPKFGGELEFWLFQETSDSLHDKAHREPDPLSRGMFGYSWVREGQFSELMHDIVDEMEAFGVPIEGIHTETGPGVWEVALRYSDALEAADRMALFKTTMKQLVARHGISVTFMAKWSADLPGSSGHLHQSLFDSKDAVNLFFDAGAADRLSNTARHYIGGQVNLARELTALYAPFINSYKRYVPGVWAPITPSWGVENRTCTARAIVGGKGTRVEYRQPAADLNPYIAIATCLGAGLYGIEHAIDPGAQARGDATSIEGVAPLPATLEHAVHALSASDAAKEILGEAFVDHYVRTRDWEVRQYRTAVTDWELVRYFEAV